MVTWGLILKLALAVLLVFIFIIAMLMDANGLNMETHSLVQQVQLEKSVPRVQQVLQVP
jgi:cell division protein FtsL